MTVKSPIKTENQSYTVQDIQAAAVAAVTEAAESRGWVIHPAANIAPMIVDAEGKALRDSIKSQGQREAIIVTNDGVLLDGRNRLLACHALGIEPIVEIYDGEVEDVIDTIMAAENRRHLNKSQRAMVLVLQHGEREAGLAKARQAATQFGSTVGGNTSPTDAYRIWRGRQWGTPGPADMKVVNRALKQKKFFSPVDEGLFDALDDYGVWHRVRKVGRVRETLAVEHGVSTDTAKDALAIVGRLKSDNPLVVEYAQGIIQKVLYGEIGVEAGLDKILVYEDLASKVKGSKEDVERVVDIAAKVKRDSQKAVTAIRALGSAAVKEATLTDEVVTALTEARESIDLILKQQGGE